MPRVRLALGRENCQLIAHAQVGHTVNHQSHLRHLVARREVLAHIAEAHITVHHQLVVALCVLHLEAQYGGRMQNQVGVLRQRHIVLHRQRASSIVAWLDGAIAVHRAANTACATQHTLAKDIGNGARGITQSTQGATQLLTLGLSTVIVHQHTTIQDAQRARQEVVITCDAQRASTLLDDAQQVGLLVAIGRDGASQCRISVHAAQQIVHSTIVLHIALKNRASLCVQLANAEARSILVGLGQHSGTLMQCHAIVLHGSVHTGVLNGLLHILRREELTTMRQHHSIVACARGICRVGIDMHIAFIVRPVGPGSSLGRAQITAFATRIEFQQS